MRQTAHLAVLASLLFLSVAARAQTNDEKEKVPADVPPAGVKKLKDLRSSNPETRGETGAWVIGQDFGDRTDIAIPLLIDMLGDRQTYYREFPNGMSLDRIPRCPAEGAVTGLCHMGIDALPAVIRAAKSKDPYIRSRAVEALSRIVTSRDMDKLTDLMIWALEDGDEAAKSSAARGLQKVHNWRAVSPLIKALKNENVRVSAADALADYRLWPAAIDEVVLLLKDADPAVRRQATFVLAEQGDQHAVEPLQDMLRSPDLIYRARVASYLWALTHDRQSLDILIEMLKSGDENVKHYAAEGLGKCRHDDAVLPLVKAVKEDNSRGRMVSSAAASSLAKQGMPGVTALLDLLKDERQVARLRAAQTLEGVSDPRAVEPLIAALGDSDKEVRAFAARSLGHFHDARAIAPLLTLLSCDDHSTRIDAASSLGKIGEQALSGLIAILHDKNQKKQAREAVLYALVTCQRTWAVPGLIEALSDSEREIRQRARGALTRLADKDYGDDPRKWLEWWRSQAGTSPNVHGPGPKGEK